MKRKIALFFGVCFMLLTDANAHVNYGDWFEERSLRLDYIFSGDSVNQRISIDEMMSMPYWSGRRNNLEGTDSYTSATPRPTN